MVRTVNDQGFETYKDSVDLIKSWGGATIEKEKYYALTQSCGDKIPGYVNKFPCGSYYAWNLKKIKDTYLACIGAIFMRFNSKDPGYA